MAYTRKTVDCWRFYSLIEGKWEYETTEYSRDMMKVNKKAYKENSPYPLKVVRGREKIE